MKPVVLNWFHDFIDIKVKNNENIRKKSILKTIFLQYIKLENKRKNTFSFKQNY